MNRSWANSCPSAGGVANKFPSKVGHGTGPPAVDSHELSLASSLPSSCDPPVAGTERGVTM